MATTAYYQLPYPLLTDPPDGATQIKALADKLELWKNGFTVPNGPIVGGGAFSTVIGGVTRPVPYATHARVISVPISNSENGFLQVVYATGLFTVPPIGMVTCSSSAQYYGILGTPWLAASGYYGGNHVERVAGTGNISFHTFAIQMLAGAAGGPTLARAENERPVRFTCHTPDCGNQDIPIDTDRRVDDEVPAICGPCGHPLEDMALL